MNKAFNQDTFMTEIFRDICKVHEIELIIETGTYHGDTTQVLAEMASAVISTEIIPENLTIARANCAAHKNITFLLGDSPKTLGRILPEYASKKILFFLDSHWYDKVPLLPELHAIAAAGLKPVICIHDFFVPGKSDPNDPKAAFGFDVYHGQKYDMDFIRPAIQAIYGESGYSYHYNHECTGAQRGAIFIFPK